MKNLYVSVINEKVDILTQVIEKKLIENPKNPLNAFDLITKFSLDTMCESAMGINVDSQRKSGNSYSNILNRYEYNNIFILININITSQIINKWFQF